MHTNISQAELSQPRLRAVVEIVDGKLKIYPIADTDVEERLILDALRFVREDFQA